MSLPHPYKYPRGIGQRCSVFTRSKLAGLAATAFTSLALLTTSSAVLAQDTLYWDTNGNAAGATNNPDGSASGIWGTNPYWSPIADGTGLTGAWSNGDNKDVIFSAGTNATGTSLITISGQRIAHSVTVKEGTVSFSGGDNALVLRGTDKTTIQLGPNANGHARFDAGIAFGNLYYNQTFANGSAAGDLIFERAILNANQSTAIGTYLTLSASNTGGFTFNAAVGGKYNVNSNSTMHLVINSSGAGVTTLNAINAYTGSTLVNAGTLVIGNSGSINSTSSVQLNGATAVLRYDGNTALNKTVTFGANGGLFLYNSTNKYTGGGGSTSVAANEIVGGAGTLGHVTITSGGTLRPGNLGNGSAGALTVDSLTLQSGAVSELDILSAGLFDSIESTGLITLGGTLHLDFSGLMASGNLLKLFTTSAPDGLTGNFTNISATGAYEGSFLMETGFFRLHADDQILTFDHVTGEFTFQTIPEPSAILLLGSGLTFILFRRARRQRLAKTLPIFT